VIRLERLCLHYADAAEPTLSDVTLRIAPGELVLIAGPTGCGKSSLLNCMNGILLDETAARVEGTVLLGGRDVRRMELAEICRLAGTVFQNPDSQICTATPETEIAFGLENLGVDRATMVRRIDEALRWVGLEAARRQPTLTLSGGQKQRLAIACALALQPRVLFLDEPLSQLDPKGVAGILRVIGKLKSAQELTVVLVEHRVEETVALADRVVLMDQGRIVSDCPQDAALADLSPMRRLGLNLPLLADLFERMGRPERPLRAGEAPLLRTFNAAEPLTDSSQGDLPISGGEVAAEDSPADKGRQAAHGTKSLSKGPSPPIPLPASGARGAGSPIGSYKKTASETGVEQPKPHGTGRAPAPQAVGLGGRSVAGEASPTQGSAPREALLEIRGLGFDYGRHARRVFEGLSLSFCRGDRVALMGPNGSGKSTLLHLMAGLERPCAGRIAWTTARAPSVGLVMQAPDLMLFCSSVREEVAFAPLVARVPLHQRQRIVEAALGRMGLHALADQAPLALSRGQRLRAAVASILSKQPSVLLLDEPTTGQARREIERMMTGLERDFELVVFCTHDVQTASRHATRIVLLEAGRVVADGDPLDVLFDAPAMRRASIRMTSLQAYALRHGVKALDVDSLLEMLA
jgi:energy-coupling factor transporter ATP-binding protein EcfA2